MAGKKGKKGKSGTKGKSSRKGKKGKKGAIKEPQMTSQEAILAYQINVIEQKLEDISYETRGWEERNKRNRLRNEKLREEEELLLKNLLKENRNEVELLQGQELTTRDDVNDFMKETWRKRKEREHEIEDMKRKITKTEEEIQTVTEEMSFWRSFQESGQHQLQMQIKLLEQELRDIEITFEDMTAHSTRDNEKALTAMHKDTEVILSQQKDKAAERALAQLDKKDRQEMLDNNWLNREVAIHRVETEKVRAVVELLEQENLELISELFDCSVEDLQISRSFFLTQSGDSENLDHTGVLEVDLSTITVPTEEEFEQQVQKPISKRPKSAVQKAVEGKVFSLSSHGSSHDDTQEVSDGDTDDTNGASESYSLEEDNFEDYLPLGPLELKLLSVTGQQMPIHRPETPPEDELECSEWNPDRWPVTVAMLKGPLMPEVS